MTPFSRNVDSLVHTAEELGHGASLLPFLHHILLAYKQRIHSFGLPSGVAYALLCLHQQPDKAEPAQIADLCDIPRQTMTSLIDVLERRALAHRDDHPTDRRRKVVRLTPAGTALAKQIIADILDVEARALDVITPGQMPLARELVRRFTEELDRLNAIDLPLRAAAPPPPPVAAAPAVPPLRRPSPPKG